MTREIKFRCWYGNEFIYPDCVGIDDIGPYFIEDAIIQTKLLYCNDIQQYTGLKDANGVEIYEGDIVVFRDWYPKTVVFGDDMCKCVGFSLKNTLKALYTYDANRLKIIGNIYENPELVEQNDLL